MKEWEFSRLKKDVPGREPQEQMCAWPEVLPMAEVPEDSTVKLDDLPWHELRNATKPCLSYELSLNLPRASQSGRSARQLKPSIPPEQRAGLSSTRGTRPCELERPGFSPVSWGKEYTGACGNLIMPWALPASASIPRDPWSTMK